MTAPAKSFWISRTRRRVAVCCLYLGYAAGLALSALISRGSLPGSPGIGLMVLAGLSVLSGLAGIIQSRRTLFLASTGPLDERQRAIRDRAYYTAYKVLSLLSIAAAVYLTLLYRDSPSAPLPGSGVTVILGAGVVLLVMTLPSAMMAWTEPDPPEDSGAQPVINRRAL